VPIRPAFSSATARVLKSPAATAVSTMSLAWTVAAVRARVVMAMKLFMGTVLCWRVINV